MCHDRLLVDDMPVTHEFLALMLGVRRSGVTDHLHILEGMRAIKSTRGNVKIMDRQILLDVADGCYGAPEAEYERLLGSPSSDDARPARLKGRGVRGPDLRSIIDKQPQQTILILHAVLIRLNNPRGEVLALRIRGDLSSPRRRRDRRPFG